MITVDRDELRKNVKRGAALLDQYFGNPTWRKKCEGMDIAHPDTCILSQLFGSYSKTCDELGIGYGDNHGFDLPSGQISMPNYEVLQELWNDEFANPPLGTDD